LNDVRALPAFAFQTLALLLPRSGCLDRKTLFRDGRTCDRIGRLHCGDRFGPR
jgi:hypothetical protein